MIGPCVLDPGPDTVPDWLASIDRPIVLVTTSSEKQADTNLVPTAMTALADEPVHVVATLPAGQPDDLRVAQCDGVPVRPARRGARPRSMCGHARRDGRDSKGARPWRTGVRRAVRARPIRGRTARRGSPVRHPPAGQETVAAAAAHEGARSDDMTAGARRVAAGFAATGGAARGADLFEQRVLGLNAG